MTDYGLLETGFLRKPAAQIRADLVTAIRQIDGLQNARIGPGSVLGNLVDTFTNELSAVWEGAEGVYHSLNRDSASGQSLDNVMALVGKSRDLATETTTTLTLWTVSASDVSVPAGNQVAQSDTGILFETTEDAVIPAAVTVHEDLELGNVTWQSGNITRYFLPASTDLSGVVAGDLLIATGCAISGNNGAFPITTISDASDWLEVTNPQRSDASGDEVGSDGVVTVTDGLITVAAQAIDAGATEATAQSIDTINTPITDWDGVVNLADAQTGRDRETDAAFRARVALELVIAQGSTLEAIKARIRLIDGVTYVAGEENRTATTDGNGNLPHSYRFTVVGGADQDIIDAIGTYKAGGIATNGGTSGTYTDPEDGAHTLYFDRVTEVEPYIIVNLTTNADYPADGDALIEAALTTYSDTLEHGEDLINYKLVGAIAESDVPGITAVVVLQGLSDPPTLSANTAISATEIAVLAADRITVNS